mgnify:CR=1 FL=1
MSKSFEELMNMSDEDFINMPPIVSGSSEEAGAAANASEENENEGEGNVVENEQVETAEGQEGEAEGKGQDANEDTGKGDGDQDGNTVKSEDHGKDKENRGEDASGSDNKEKKADNKESDSKTDKKTLENKNENNQVAPDYEKLYKEIMKPFKANGREIKLNSPEEAITLMQKGANYTKKMQALQPHLKIVRMLENNQLLDEGKLTQLIDISRGDKTAIAKFIKDSGIDPMDIDPESAVNYKPGNHSVSDSDIEFSQLIEEINSTDHGQDLIIEMQHQWDQSSKQAIYKEPALIRVLAQQKADGIYDQIAEVVQKEKLLGHPQIAGLPFIHAYKVVGEALAKQGLLKPKAEAAISNAGTAQPSMQEKATQVLGRGPAPSKKSVTNDAAVKAASPSAKSNKKAIAEFNPLAMSDEDFLKQL